MKKCRQIHRAAEDGVRYGPGAHHTELTVGGDNSETLDSGKEICVTGMIQSYQRKPEIVVKDPAQVRVK